MYYSVKVSTTDIETLNEMPEKVRKNFIEKLRVSDGHFHVLSYLGNAGEYNVGDVVVVPYSKQIPRIGVVDGEANQEEVNQLLAEKIEFKEILEVIS